MSEEKSTSKIPRLQGLAVGSQSTSGGGSATSEHMRSLTRRVNDALQLLRSQRDMLRQRGMNLPPSAIDGLRSLKTRIDQLSKSMLDSQVQLRSLRALAETTAVINSAQSLDETLNQVMDTVIQLTGAERGYIVLKNKETGELDFAVARGMDQEQIEGKKVVSRTVVNQVADTGEPVLTDNASTDERYAGQDSIVGFQLRSILAVPLKMRDEVIGVVYCDNRILAGLFKNNELDVLNAFANQAAVAIENARLFESMRARLAEVREMSSLMDNIFTSIASGIIILDHNDRVIISNALAHSIVGTEEISGMRLDEFMPPLSDEFYQMLQRIHEESVVETMVQEPELSGSKRHWTIAASPLRDESGRSTGVALVLDDLTEQIEREAQLKEVRRFLPSALVENVTSLDDLDFTGQERIISALFCDIRGFTSFSENLEPEELMTVINQYLSLASDSINLFEGIVDKYMGDAVTGLFNTQLNPQEDDHALRAVQAGWQLLQDLEAHWEIMPEDQQLVYGVGVHTGPAVMGNVGSSDRKELAALGEAMDYCKFLQEQADRRDENGNALPEMVISAETYEFVKDKFECEPMTELPRPKKGYEHVKLVYRVVKRKKGSLAAMFIDDDLLDLLKED